jgi:hypothetical protein
VVNFWATWCPPCKEEMPEFSRLKRKYANGVQFVGISIDSADKVLHSAKKRDFLSPAHQQSGNLDLSSDLGNRAKALPFTIILGRTAARNKSNWANSPLRIWKKPSDGAPAALTFRHISQFWTICFDFRQTCRHETKESRPKPAKNAKGKQRILVVHGPNLNLLGSCASRNLRAETLADINASLANARPRPPRSN